MSPPNLPGWDDVPVVKFFEDRFHVPTAVQNDANACALAEYLYGSGRGVKNLVFDYFGPTRASVSFLLPISATCKKKGGNR
jgi:glucokinase